jgi:hypothetical protein
MNELSLESVVIGAFGGIVISSIVLIVLPWAFGWFYDIVICADDFKTNETCVSTAAQSCENKSSDNGG